MSSSLLDRLARGSLLADGAMGTQLFARGITSGPLELANVERPDDVRSVHLGYLSAGSELIETNTFGANASRLAAHGMGRRVAELNRAGVRLAKEAARLHGQQVWIAGAMGPLAPERLGVEALGAGAAQHVFAEQASALAEAGADLLILETFGSLAQLRLAIAAVKSAAGLPVVAQLTFNDDGLTRDGDSAEDAASMLSVEDVVAIGANCSVGPYAVGRTIERMARASDLPLSWQPNAGLPTYEERRLRYTASPAYFADLAREAVRSGAARRLRPVLMTIATDAIGLLPIMWSAGAGADVMKRIATPLVGGVVTTGLVVLFLLPAVYCLWKGRELSAHGGLAAVHGNQLAGDEPGSV